MRSVLHFGIDTSPTYNIYGLTGGPDDGGGKPGPSPAVRPDQPPIPREQPDRLSAALAVKIVRLIAADTDNIVVIPYGRRRAQQRNITRRQIELCVQKGTITEGPFLNQHGN